MARLDANSTQAADRSTATLTLFLTAVWALVLVARPYTWWRAVLVAAMVGAFALAALVPFTARFFALSFTDPVNDLLAVAMAAAAALIMTVLRAWNARRTSQHDHRWIEA